MDHVKPIGESFEPKEKYTVRLRDILSQYPDSTQLVKELLQNAEDARASCFRLIIDRRRLGTSTLLEESLAPYQVYECFALVKGKTREEDLG